MKLALPVFFLLVFGQSFSQVLIKPKIGTAISCMQTDLTNYSTNGQVSKARIQAGVAVELPFKKRLSLQPELLYTIKGIRDTLMFITGRGRKQVSGAINIISTI